MENTEGVTVSSPLYLVSAMQPCNLCGKENEVAAIATERLVDEFEPEEGDGFLLCYAEELPAEVLAEVLKRHPNFEMRNSQTAGQTYYMSTCECGGHYGDHFVQKQLFQQIAYQQDQIKLEQLPVTGSWVIPCGYSQSSATWDLLNKK